jgi:hypothetical protein
MPTIQILLRVTKDIGAPADDLPGQGHRFVFTNDLALERYDDSTPGSGLPVSVNERRAGTHSGVVTVVRIAAADDDFFPPDSVLFQYEATYKFNALDDTPLQKGQVTAQGLFLVDNVDDFNTLEPPIRFAITGGTGPYASVHGTVTEGVRGTSTEPERLLDIEL